MPGASRIIERNDLLTMKCDILVPAAMENAITLNNVEQVKARIIVEIANGPTTPHSDEVLARKGVFLVPDILAGAGEITAGSFEEAHASPLALTVADLNARLEATVRRAFNDVYEMARKHHTHMRTGALRSCRESRGGSHHGARSIPINSFVPFPAASE